MRVRIEHCVLRAVCHREKVVLFGREASGVGFCVLHSAVYLHLLVQLEGR